MLRATSLLRVAALARPFAVRTFAAGAKAVVKAGPKATDLASVLADEISYEKDEGSASDSQLASIAQSLHSSSGFKVEDVAGSSRFSLVKTLQDGKKVTVEIDCNPISSEKDDYEGEDDEGRNEEDEEDDGMEEGYRCLISVEDSGKTMQIGAFVTDQLRIQRVTLFPANKAPTADSIFSGLEETSVYGGPVFDELDDTLQNAFYDWLGNMGVDDDLAARVSDYASSKEQHEYVGWLKGVHGFVAKK